MQSFRSLGHPHTLIAVIYRLTHLLRFPVPSSACTDCFVLPTPTGDHIWIVYGDATGSLVHACEHGHYANQACRRECTVVIYADRIVASEHCTHGCCHTVLVAQDPATGTWTWQVPSQARADPVCVAHVRKHPVAHLG
jgi:hypothetical protein